MSVKVILSQSRTVFVAEICAGISPRTEQSLAVELFAGRLKSREWTTWHEEKGVDNARVIVACLS